MITQIYNDLFGKDVEGRLTYTYDWMADQFSHIFLGFLPTALLYWQLNTCSWWIPFMVFLFWAAKEIRDLVAVELDCKNVWFRPSMRDLVLNVLCAIFYFTIGIILAITTMVENTVWFIPLILIFGVAYAYPWLKLKINLQNSNMPFMTRISEFDEKKLDDESRIIIQNLIDGNAGSFLIAGKNGEDKSTLGMAIVSEYIFNGNTARYFTFEQFLENDNNIEEKMVVVDNINPFLDGDDTTMNKIIVANEIMKKNFNEDITKTFVWIVGDGAEIQDWKKLFKAESSILVN